MAPNWLSSAPITDRAKTSHCTFTKVNYKITKRGTFPPGAQCTSGHVHWTRYPMDTMPKGHEVYWTWCPMEINGHQCISSCPLVFNDVHWIQWTWYPLDNCTRMVFTLRFRLVLSITTIWMDPMDTIGSNGHVPWTCVQWYPLDIFTNIHDFHWTVRTPMVSIGQSNGIHWIHLTRLTTLIKSFYPRRYCIQIWGIENHNSSKLCYAQVWGIRILQIPHSCVANTDLRYHWRPETSYRFEESRTAIPQNCVMHRFEE